MTQAAYDIRLANEAMHQLMSQGQRVYPTTVAVRAMQLDRKRMAEALRDRVINNNDNIDADPMIQPLLLRIDEMLFALAAQIEEGTVGITWQASLAGEGEDQSPRQPD